jgi:hypothetical protein
MNHSNATMAMSSFDRASGPRPKPTGQPYNNFRVQTQGGNIIQGQVNKIRVAEIVFPYCIPTIISQVFSPGSPDRAGNGVLYFEVWSVTNGATAVVAGPLGGALQINIPTGFYTGTELAASIQGALVTIEAAQGIPAGTFTFTYDTVSGSFILQNTVPFDATAAAVNYFAQFIWAPGSPANEPFSTLSQPNALWTLGFRQIFADNPALPNSAFTNRLPLSGNTWMIGPPGYNNTAVIGGISGYPVFPAGYIGAAIKTSQYTGLYTQWIDVCSPSLCQAQYVRDGNTNQQTINRDLICRLYITNEVSLFQTDPTGTRPFVIHRQFKNAKIMKWTAERSIDNIDIRLFDMYGNPLPVIPGYVPAANPNNLGYDQIIQGQPSDFAITFLVDEQDKEMVTQSENIGYRY